MTQDLASLRPRHPSLYRLAADGRSLDFWFAQCPQCARLSFPANVPGCAQCGQPLTEADRVARPGGGELLECVTLHTALAPGLAAPCVVADIRIAEGVVQEGVLAAADDAGLRPGMSLKAIAQPMASGERFDCRFVPEGP
jgi:uncharacterized OB-fold protein